MAAPTHADAMLLIEYFKLRAEGDPRAYTGL